MRLPSVRKRFAALLVMAVTGTGIALVAPQVGAAEAPCYQNWMTFGDRNGDKAPGYLANVEYCSDQGMITVTHKEAQCAGSHEYERLGCTIDVEGEGTSEILVTVTAKWCFWYGEELGPGCPEKTLIVSDKMFSDGTQQEWSSTL